MALKFEMVSPTQTLLSEEVDSLTLMTEMGEITVLPGHIPLVANLLPGEALVKVGGEEKAFAVFGGFLQVQPGNRVIVLADEAERVEDLILEEAEAAQERAQELLKEKFTTGDYEDASLSLQREMARVRLARKYKAKGYRATRVPAPGPAPKTEN